MNIQFPSSFNRDENGSITLFIVMMFLIMVLGSGMAIDFMRYESERASLQDAIDRGVLSAASLRRAGGDHAEAEAIVNSYLLSNSIGLKNVTTTITTDLGINSRRVNIEADYTINTIFLKLAGIPTLLVNAQSSAEEKRSDIEISMVLDISGSMGGSKIADLRDGAKEFVSLIITPETVDKTTISLAPFTRVSRVSPTLVDEYNTYMAANEATCFDFTDPDFTTTVLDTAATYSSKDGYKSSICDPNSAADAYREVRPLSNSVIALHDAIDDLEANGGTDTSAGLRWGVALLDPDTQPIINNLTTVMDGFGNPVVDPLFFDRPAAYNDTDTMKFVILMTDGDNNYSSGNTRTTSLCEKTKDAGIIVYSIAYQVADGSTAHTLMENCASGPSKFYGAADMDLEVTFRQIAQSIQKLRLVN